jgi:hypothetical protein
MGKSLVVAEAPINPSFMSILAGILTLTAACFLIRFMNTEKIRRLISRLKRRCVREINEVEAIRVWSAIHCSKRWAWTRTACLESSLAFVLFASAKKLSADWCVGVKLAPFESHAWVEAGGIPVQEPDRIKVYKKIIVA